MTGYRSRIIVSVSGAGPLGSSRNRELIVLERKKDAGVLRRPSQIYFAKMAPAD